MDITDNSKALVLNLVKMNCQYRANENIYLWYMESIAETAYYTWRSIGEILRILRKARIASRL